MRRVCWVWVVDGYKDIFRCFWREERVFFFLSVIILDIWGLEGIIDFYSGF